MFNWFRKKKPANGDHPVMINGLDMSSHIPGRKRAWDLLHSKERGQSVEIPWNDLSDFILTTPDSVRSKTQLERILHEGNGMYYGIKVTTV